jgi:hypothetical protein
MLAESRKGYRHGFVLTEAELRRFVDTAAEQFGKLQDSNHPEITFELKYKNGVVAEKASIDEVLSQENIGSSQIVRLNAKFISKEKPDDIQMSFEFIDVDHEDEAGLIAIRHMVRGDSRDWVFVTSALLEERVAKIKRFIDPHFLKRNRIGRMGFFLFFPILMGLITFFIINLVVPQEEKPSLILERAWRNGEVKDPIEAIILLEKSKETKEPRFDFHRLRRFIIVFGGIILFIGGIALLGKYYPLYNFCWGDYIEVFQHKESVRKFVFVVLLIGIIVSFVGGVLANLIKIRT